MKDYNPTKFHVGNADILGGWVVAIAMLGMLGSALAT
jgi:hypothetical protein